MLTTYSNTYFFNGHKISRKELCLAGSVITGLLDPGSSFRIMDPQIRNRKKYLRFHNTAASNVGCHATYLNKCKLLVVQDSRRKSTERRVFLFCLRGLDYSKFEQRTVELFEGSVRVTGGLNRCSASQESGLLNAMTCPKNYQGSVLKTARIFDRK